MASQPIEGSQPAHTDEVDLHHRGRRLPDFNHRIHTILALADYPQIQDLFNQMSPWKEKYENGEIPSHSAQEYALMLFDHGLQARGEGNYGIAAMAIWRPGTVADENGKIVIRPADEKKDWLEIAVTKPEMANQPVEIIVFGHNQLISRYNPNGHAERVATKKLSHLMARLDDDQVGGYLNTLEKESQIMFRPATTTEASIGMATTLEPCIGCTEEIMTTGYDWVLSLNEDPWAGGMHDDRRQKLATIWSETLPKANNLQIIFAQAENDQDLLTYLPAELAEINNQLFEQTRVALDEVLGSGGIFGQIPWARNGK